MNCENQKSRIVKIKNQELLNSKSNKINNSNNNISNNLSHNGEKFFCTLKKTYDGVIDENCKTCYLINSCPFDCRFTSKSESDNLLFLTAFDCELLMEQIFLLNPYYDINSRINLGNVTTIEKNYYFLEEDEHGSLQR